MAKLAVSVHTPIYTISSPPNWNIDCPQSSTTFPSAKRFSFMWVHCVLAQIIFLTSQINFLASFSNTHCWLPILGCPDPRSQRWATPWLAWCAITFLIFGTRSLMIDNHQLVVQGLGGSLTIRDDPYHRCATSTPSTSFIWSLFGY